MEEDKTNNIKMNIQISSLDKYIDNKIKKINLNSILSIFGMNYGIFKYIEKINDTKEKYNSSFEFKNTIKNAIINIKYNKNVMENNSFKKDLINFYSKENKRKYGLLIGRYNHYKINNFYQLKIKSIIKIQKNIKHFLTIRCIQKLILFQIRKRIYNKIILIQKYYRKYNTKIKLKKALIIKSILEQRKKKYNTLENCIKRYFYKNKIKKFILINRIFKKRLEKILFIQGAIKSYYMKKLYKAIVDYEKYHYTLTYPYKAKTVKFLLFNNTSSPFMLNSNKQYKEFSFELCPIRKIFVLYIFKNHIRYGKYRCQFIVDGKITCDGRFPHLETLKGEFYNYIYFDPYQTHLEDYNHNNESYIKENNIYFDNDNYSGINDNKINYIENNTKSYATTNSNSNSSYRDDMLFRRDYSKDLLDFFADI